MILWHATQSENLPSIRQRGLLCAMSQGKKQVVWLHAKAKREWAGYHVVRRHGGRIEDVVWLPVNCTGNVIRRWGKGLFYAVVDAYASEIGKAVTFEEISRSPAEGRE